MERFRGPLAQLREWRENKVHFFIITVFIFRIIFNKKMKGFFSVIAIKKLFC